MAKVNMVRCKDVPQRRKVTRSTLPSCSKDLKLKKKNFKPSEKKDWDLATCSVCLEYPHNAVLLLCSSFKKGCRPYMCSTSRRFSNCLDQYKKAYTKVTSIKSDGLSGNLSVNSGLEQVNDKNKVPELLCPLCREQVKGFAVVERARKYFNAKKRSCMQDGCSFVGSYRQLRKHVRAEHPLARPRAVDPVLEEKWKKLERERDRSDVISAIISSTPGAMVVGDYVIEPGTRDYDDYSSDDSLDDGFLPFDPFDLGFSNGISYGSDGLEYDLLDGDHYRIPRFVPTGTAALGRGLQRLALGSRRRSQQRYRRAGRSRSTFER